MAARNLEFIVYPALFTPFIYLTLTTITKGFILTTPILKVREPEVIPAARHNVFTYYLLIYLSHSFMQQLFIELPLGPGTILGTGNWAENKVFDFRNNMSLKR